MANFNTYAPILKRLEGGYSEDPTDLGNGSTGATMCGVTLTTYQMYYGKDKTKQDLKHITDEQWTYITKKGFWTPWKADQIENQYVAQLCVDWGYNSGTRNAIKRVQRLFKLKDDGIVGPVTLRALNAPDWKHTFDIIYQARLDYYNAIVKRNPSQKKYLNGWISRISKLHY